MNTDSTALIYFSPTGSTEKIAKSIAEGLGSGKVREIPLTFAGKGTGKLAEGETAVIAVPVYAGRVPETFIERFKSVEADNNPAVLAVVYGNRAFDDALLELRNICKKKNFRVIAAAAFIGEHSFSNNDKPVAEGRPEIKDLKKAESFGAEAAEKLKSDKLNEPAVPGNFPYRDGASKGGTAPDTDNEKCIKCGKCVSACPEGIIRLTDSVYTDNSGCIMCCACIKVCPESARNFNNSKVEGLRTMLFEKYSSPRNPEIFL